MPEVEAREASDLRAEFIEQQQRGLGATDSPKILGFSRWGSGLTVWDRLTNGPKEGEPSLPAWLGQKMESTVAELFVTATGLKVRAANGHYVHRTLPFIVCHLDYRVVGTGELLECKTRQHMKGYGPDGSTQIPADVWVQVQHEMAVTGAPLTYVAVLFGHHTFRVYPIPRDDEFIAKMEGKLQEFWELYVVPRIPPPVSGHPSDADWLGAEYPEHDDSMLASTAEQDATLIPRLRLARANYVQAEAARDEVHNQIKQAIGEHAGIAGSWGRVTWKRSKPTEETDWQQVALGYGRLIDRLFELINAESFDVSELEIMSGVYQTTVGLYTTTKPGSRRLYVDLREE